MARSWPGGENKIGGRAPHHEACEALGALLPCAATVVSPIAGWCRSRATPRGSAVEAHCATTAGRQRAERTADGGGVDVPRVSLCRHVRRAFMRNAVLDFTLIRHYRV